MRIDIQHARRTSTNAREPHAFAIERHVSRIAVPYRSLHVRDSAGGDISIDSVEGRGTTVTLIVPEEAP